MLNSKQRAQLKGLANSIDPIFQIGKGGVGEQLIRQVDETIEIRELIKITVLETCTESAGECAEKVAEGTKSDVVQVIGRKFILYRPCSEKEKRKIKLVK